jgi:hypothetical protein
MDATTIGSFISLGFDHITAAGALDHILFLLVLAAIHRWQEWRQALVVVTAFTVGHSITLAMTALRPGMLPHPALVEFLIPRTIVPTGIENLLTRGVVERRVHTGRRAALAGIFGLVHGAGFAGYLTAIFPGPIVLPLLGFNLGIELGQVVVLVAAFAALAVLDRGMRLLARGDSSGFRLRVASVSLLVAVVGSEVWLVR